MDIRRLAELDRQCIDTLRFLKHHPAHPLWPDRDRFVLSAGHGSALLYRLSG